MRSMSELVEPDERLACRGEHGLEHLPMFLAARGTTYLGWVHPREDTQTTRELTPFLIERACSVGDAYLAAVAGSSIA